MGRAAGVAGDADERARHVVLVGELRERAIWVDGVNERVASRGEAGDVDLLALEVRVVVVAVPDRDALAQGRQAGTALAAVGLGEGGGAASAAERTGRGRGVAIFEAEAGLVVPPEPPSAVGPAQLVAHKAEVVPVAVVGGAHVAQARGQRAPLQRAVAAGYDLRRGQEGPPARMTAGFDHQRSGAEVVGRRAKAEPEAPQAVAVDGADGELPRRLGGEVRQHDACPTRR